MEEGETVIGMMGKKQERQRAESWLLKSYYCYNINKTWNSKYNVNSIIPGTVILNLSMA